MAAHGRVEWSPRALRDLIAIYRYTLSENPRAAAEQSEHIIERAESLGPNPRLGKPSRLPGWRVLVLTRFPYSVYYRHSQRTIQVLRVVHQRRQFP
ncbi:MAG: type II toxin-antitoxin system RelE/ParE family toxin [Burkholderiales bacterium]|nr:type II toxin-antitoxin system RelE/ParE family toxin [Burkholderiales bacterium]